MSSIGLLAACVAPKERLGQFGDRVVDASNVAPSGACDQDISGLWLFSIDPKPISAGSIIRAEAEVTWEGSDQAGYQLGFTLYPLDIDTFERLPDDPGKVPIEWPAVACEDGAFAIEIDGLVIPGRANAAVPDLEVTVNDGDVTGTVVRANHYCGTLSGMTNLGSNLAGSTFGARRLAAPNQGSKIPPAISECQEDDFEADAGVEVDAAVPDAAMPDAMPDPDR